MQTQIVKQPKDFYVTVEQAKQYNSTPNKKELIAEAKHYIKFLKSCNVASSEIDLYEQELQLIKNS